MGCVISHSMGILLQLRLNQLDLICSVLQIFKMVLSIGRRSLTVIVLDLRSFSLKRAISYLLVLVLQLVKVSSLKNVPTAVFASYLIRLRVNKLVTPGYLYAFFQSPSYWEQISVNTVGSAQPNCNATKLASVKVPIPSLEEQHHIVSHLKNFQEKISGVKVLQAQTAQELDCFLPSFIDGLFRQAE